MLVKQISVFLENKSGRLAKVTKLIGENNINISALSIADTTDFGILRIIVSKPELAEEILKKNDFTVSITNVIAIAVPNSPGGLAIALTALEGAKISIEYMYSIIEKRDDQALIVLRVENTQRAIEVLTNNNIHVLSSKEVYEF